MIVAMGDRTTRPTQFELAAPVEARTTTEEISVVLPAFGDTVTVTEYDPGNDAGAGAEYRATLVLVAGPTPGQVYSLKAETLIGRDAMADIVIEDTAVSRRHVRISGHDGAFFVEDLGSANGTFVLGVKVSRQLLESGDRIQLGPRVVLRFALLDEVEERMHRQLFESATRDPLTSAYNKKYITERLVAEVAHALRHHSSLEVVVCDLDKFKQVNDRYGHLVGDAVLQAVSARMQGVIRSEDVLGRFGGEEFVVISRGSDAARLAERIRAAVEQFVISTALGPLRVTLSLGVARLDEVSAHPSAISLLEKADRRLLVAKESGRNRVRAED